MSAQTTLQHLPNELLQCILVRAVSKEVKDMKLSKTVWKEKADLVISRLRTVCSQWNSVLMTDCFQNELHRIFDNTVELSIRLEVLHQSKYPVFIYKLITLNTDLLILCLSQERDYHIRVSKVNTMTVVHDVIPLPGILPVDMTACNVSNCVYLLKQERNCFSVLRITKTENVPFIVSPWIRDLKLDISSIFVSSKGNVLLLSVKKGQDSSAVSTYNVDGVLQSKMILPDNVDVKQGDSLLEKHDGHIIMVSSNEQGESQLTELNRSASVIRHYSSSLGFESCVSFADDFQRIVMFDSSKTAELLDSELNVLAFVLPVPNVPKFDFIHYVRATKQLIGVNTANFTEAMLTLMRFAEIK